MPLAGNPYHLAVVFVVAVVLSLLGWNRDRVVSACGRLSFIIAAAWMLFGEGKRWYPPGFAILATATWVLSGCVVSLVVWEIASRLQKRPPDSNTVTQ